MFGQGFSWRDLILIAGGLFLVWKATKEIHHRVDPDPGPDMFDRKRASLGFAAAIGQILMLDLVFSIDSIITAVGMTEHVPIMVIAVVVTVMLMLVAATPLANFINANPTIVMLALGFLLMIGMVLIAEGFGAHIPKGYVYAAMAFSALVEGLNMLARRAPSGAEVGTEAAQGAGGRVREALEHGLEHPQGTPAMSTAPTVAQPAKTRDGNGIVYDIHGPTGCSVQRIVLVHSLAMERGFWDGVAAALGTKAAVLALDCRGHGASDKPNGPYTVEQIADDVADVMAHAGWTSAAVAGCSMGGCIALAFAIRHPARTTGPRPHRHHRLVRRRCAQGLGRARRRGDRQGPRLADRLPAHALVRRRFPRRQHRAS